LSKHKLYDPTSFISEHSAEYVLVPRLKSILHKSFDIVTPIFPFLTREGGRIALDIHKNEKFYVIGLYPRRPKMLSGSDSDILVKINFQLLRAAESGKQLGVPMIAGCPLAKNFIQLSENSLCLWISLDDVPLDDYYLGIGKSNLLDTTLKGNRPRFIREEELLTHFSKTLKLLSFPDIISAFREINKSYLGYHNSFSMFGIYKPVYFLLR
jgi:hypothetical protein